MPYDERSGGVIAEDVQGSETGQWPGDRMGRIRVPTTWPVDGRLESESGLRREGRVEDGGRKCGFGGRRGIWRRLVPSGEKP